MFKGDATGRFRYDRDTNRKCPIELSQGDVLEASSVSQSLYSVRQEARKILLAGGVDSSAKANRTAHGSVRVSELADVT